MSNWTRRASWLASTAATVGICLTGAMPAAANHLAIGPLVAATGASPYFPGCSGHDEPGTNFLNTEVEPWISVNRSDGRLSGAWQQDRWSNGGAHNNNTAYSTNGGGAWTESSARFARCEVRRQLGSPDVSGELGSLFDRATDPWVSFGPTGVLHNISDSINLTGPGFGNGSGILYSRSTNGGVTWSKPIALRLDLINTVLNDKESITADPNDANYVYAVWDRLAAPPSGRSNPRATEHALGYRGPTWFARSTDGGQTWEPARIILDPGTQNQTIGSQIVVRPSGELVNGFDLIFNRKNAKGVRGFNVAVQLSTDKGASWSEAIIVDKHFVAPVTTPGDNLPVRTGDILPEIAVDRSTGPHRGRVYMVWQDGRFKGGRAGIALAFSDDGGRSWSPTRRVDDVPAAAFTASVDVNDSGEVAVTYYSFAPDAADTATALTDYRIAHSSDGVNFAPSQTVGAPFDMKTAPVARGFFLGDYEGLDHFGNSFQLFFARTTGNTANSTDIWHASAG